MSDSRGNAISAYSPAFAKGAQVYGANIAPNAITSAHIAAGTIVASDIGAGSITSAKIGTGAVVAIKIGAGAVTSAKIGTGAVVATLIGAGAVTSAKIGAAAVTNAKMKAAFLSGTISGLAAGAAIAVAHGLGVKPKSVIACMLPTNGEITAKHTVAPAGASASTSSTIYLVSSKTGNVKYAAYVQI